MLMFERLITVFLLEIHTKIALEEPIDTAWRMLRDGRPGTDNPLIHQKLAQIYVEVEILRLSI
jgi:hypothetical protein